MYTPRTIDILLTESYSCCYDQAELEALDLLLYTYKCLFYLSMLSMQCCQLQKNYQLYIYNLPNDIMKELERMFKWNCDDVSVIIFSILFYSLL